MLQILIRPKKKMLLLAVLLFSLSAWAEPETIPAEEDVAQQVQAAYQKTENFTANFSQKTKVAMMDKLVEKEGQMIFARSSGTEPGRWVVEYKKPEAKKYTSNGTTLWIYRPQDKEVEIYDNAADLVAKEALVFLGGLAHLDSEFETSSRKKMQGEGYQLTLRPLKKGAFQKIILSVKGPRYLVTEAVVYAEGGNMTRYFFSDIKTNVKWKQDPFLFKVPQGVKELHP
ncbi:MAG: outer membrane lipoprotein carrier protein LolA [Deltaproteobacteria bacterium]|nr:outer membrane lipoprotein carrier protein LolA [Deltaproteobacteria bacterium]